MTDLTTLVSAEMTALMMLVWWREVLRWTFLLGFFFLIGVGVWAIVTITRMQREQQVALTILNALLTRVGLQRSLDKLQTGIHESAVRAVGVEALGSQTRTEDLAAQNERIAVDIHAAIEKVGNKADAAYHEANTINTKIAELNTQLLAQQDKEDKNKKEIVRAIEINGTGGGGSG